jgi:hypothetical protein
MQTLEGQIQQSQQLVQAIRTEMGTRSGPIVRKVLFTFVPPYAVMVILWFVGDFMRTSTYATVGNTLLFQMTAITTYIGMALGGYFVWRWLENIFGGWALIRSLGGVTRAVFAVEKSLEIARQQPDVAPETLHEIDTLAHSAWEKFTQAMHDSGMPVE